MSTKKEKKKVTIQRWNPSSRRNDAVEMVQVQIGTVKYKDLVDNYECLIGIETQAVDADMYQKSHVSLGAPRRITRIRWDVSKSRSVGERMDLCPRDIQILAAVLEYLKKMGFHVG